MYQLQNIIINATQLISTQLHLKKKPIKFDTVALNSNFQIIVKR